jgi:DNA polymerase-4
MRTSKRRIIFHIDMNSFYASVEMANNPSLKGKPLAIAGNVEERKGIVITSSYEARAKGVKTTMPLWQAKRLCPELIVKPPQFELYRNASRTIFELLQDYSPLVEPVSIDEAYLDITTALQNQEPPIKTAQRLQQQLKQKLDLPCSIGIAPNKFLAKMASDMKKPMGITVLRKREIQQTLWPLDVGEMHGVGSKTKEKLNGIGIAAIGDLARFDRKLIKQKMGNIGEKLWDRANGIDDRAVDPEAWSDFKSIGSSTTLPKDIDTEPKLNEVLYYLAESVSPKLRRKKVLTQNVQLTIRYGNRKTITRSRKLDNPIQTVEELYTAAKFLLIAHWDGKPVRLLGITAMDLVQKKAAVKQLDLFSYQDDTQDEKLYNTIEKLKDKYGDTVIKKGHHEN